MKTLFLEKELRYDGSQLCDHFAYRNFGLLGDSAVAFMGECEVKLDAMVDLEDVRQSAPIYSEKMLHFIIESFQLDLKGGVLLQRLFAAQILESLRKRGVLNLRRSGDDLYLGDKKFSVSIATRSTLSTLLHVGLNISSHKTPVATVGLNDLGIEAKAFGEECLQQLSQEYQNILEATYKVRGV